MALVNKSVLTGATAVGVPCKVIDTGCKDISNAVL